MDQLIECTCGHAISTHTADGCRGLRARPCQCLLNESEVLEYALNAVRTHYGTWLETNTQQR
jgi:hypothetical protein